MSPHFRSHKAGGKALLKLIGVLLFLWILRKVRPEALFAELTQADIGLLAVSFVVMIGSYAAKVLRWHVLARHAGADIGFADSWRTYNVGIFLGTITPAKVGEFGRVGHLQKAGLSMKRAVSIALLDRITDVIVIVSMTPIALLLFLDGARVLPLTAGCLLLFGIMCLASFFALRSKKMSPEIRRVSNAPIGRLATATLALSCLAWALYFLWAVLIARSVGIAVAPHVLVAAFTVAGILSLLPIAPAGLGTRDAALVALLLPYGVTPPHAVAVSLLMFLSILLGSMIGAWYFFRGDPAAS